MLASSYDKYLCLGREICNADVVNGGKYIAIKLPDGFRLVVTSCSNSTTAYIIVPLFDNPFSYHMASTSWCSVRNFVRWSRDPVTILTTPPGRSDVSNT